MAQYLARAVVSLAVCVFASFNSAAVLADPPVTLATVSEPSGRTANEPIAAEFSSDKAAHYLDTAALYWQKKRNCATCHTNMGYMFARPALHSLQKDSGEVRAMYEEYVTKRWKQNPPAGYPAVVVAAGLAFNDLQTSGRLQGVTHDAFKMMWQVQDDDGGWDWPMCGWPPMESDAHYGVTLAALAVGIAPDDYAEAEIAAAGLEKVRAYLRNNAPPSLHHRAMMAWASKRVDGIMTKDLRAKVREEVLALQRPDGGWSTAGLLADWNDFERKDGKPHDTKTSDAYGTGFTIVLARELGLPPTDERLERGIAWLQSNQRVSGKWFSRSPAKDSQQYFTNFGSAFAVLALQSCGELPGWPLDGEAK